MSLFGGPPKKKAPDPWLTMPGGPMQDVSLRTPDGKLYRLDRDNDRVEVFADDDNLIRRWGKTGEGPGQFNSPRGLAVATTGEIYVADHFNHRIQKFDSEGVFLAQWGSKGAVTGSFDRPVGLGLDSQGYLYVADSGNNRVQKFDSFGAFVLAWGQLGSGRGEFVDPFAIRVTHKDEVLVGDHLNRRIQKFDLDGTFIAEYDPQKGDLEGAGWGLEIDKNANIRAVKGGGRLFGKSVKREDKKKPRL